MNLHSLHNMRNQRSFVGILHLLCQKKKDQISTFPYVHSISALCKIKLNLLFISMKKYNARGLSRSFWWYACGKNLPLYFCQGYTYIYEAHEQQNNILSDFSQLMTKKQSFKYDFKGLNYVLPTSSRSRFSSSYHQINRSPSCKVLVNKHNFYSQENGGKLFVGAI